MVNGRTPGSEPASSPPAAVLEDAEPVTKNWEYAVGSGILGWVLDAFDFFVVVFLVDTLAEHFGVEKKEIVWTITATLAMRPFGALLFGVLADKFGRRKPLMGVVLYFSTVTILSAYAPSYRWFFILRALYGIGMGGYWGIGASLAMESAPIKKRGILSGLMQGGYPFGYLLAALAAILVIPRYGWRAMFFVGVPLAALTIYLASRAPESEAWRAHRVPSLRAMITVAFAHGRRFGYLLLVMSVMTCLSHGTQDLYPDFLRTEHGLSRDAVSYIAMFYNVGAVLGAIFFGRISERIGRRHSMIAALVLSLAAIPAWAFGQTLPLLIAGSFAMQTGVQGAFGVVPAHLNELSPDAIRGLFPGFVYQLGVLVGSPAVSIEYALRDLVGYHWALTLFEATVIAVLIVIFGFGPESRGRSFIRAAHH
jgi:SHS family lactate transporter-like MFS transporter